MNKGGQGLMKPHTHRMSITCATLCAITPKRLLDKLHELSYYHSQP